MTRQTRTTGCTMRNRKATTKVLPIAQKQALPTLPNGELFSVPQSDSVDSVLTALVNTVIG